MMFVGRKNIVPPELDRKAGTCKYKMTDSSALLRRQVDKLVNVVLRKVFCEPTVHVQSWAGGGRVKQSGNVHSSKSLNCRFSLQRKSFCTFKSQAWIFGTLRCSSFVLSFSLLSSFSLSSAFLLLLLLLDREPGSFLRMFLMLALDLRKLFLQ